MIKAILIFNNHGKPRLSKFYQRYSEDTQQQIIRETFHLVSKRDENVCNFLEGGLLIGGSDNKLIYRHYATLYFVFCVDSSESELGILDLIQVFVETLDKCFENVCELDLIFHVDKVHNILAEMVMGGMVLETNMNEIVTQIDAQNKLEKSEALSSHDSLSAMSRSWSYPYLSNPDTTGSLNLKRTHLFPVGKNKAKDAALSTPPQL
uniref:Adaptor related protein complex 3 subunit sigma 1 n=1 Tax=Taeniopygia guttata TaxID=59729 RepID=H1A4K6_TAEGU